MSDELEVIQLLDRFNYGGAERVALTYAKALNTLKIPNVVFALKSVRATCENHVLLFDNYFQSYSALKRNASNKKIALFCHTTRMLFSACLLKLRRPRSIRIVYIRHFPLKGISALFLKMLGSFVDAIVAVSPVEKSLSAGALGQRRFYINNFLDTPSTNQVAENFGELESFINGRVVVTFCGAMRLGKNPKDLVHLLSRLDKDKFCGLFVGDGVLRKEAENLAYELGLKDQVKFLGYRDDVYSILRRSKFYFFTSWNAYELMPMALLEAVSCGCRCIAYDLEVNQYLLPASNVFKLGDFDGIADAINRESIHIVESKFEFEYGTKRINELLRGLM